MTPEDLKRIEEAAKTAYIEKSEFHLVQDTNDGKRIIERSEYRKGYIAGAQCEHPIARNQAIDEVLKSMSKYEEVFITEPHQFFGMIVEEIQKLKK